MLARHDVVPAARGRFWRAHTPTVARVALLVVALYVAWIGAYLAAGHDVRDFIRIGTTYIAQGDNKSRAIRLDPGYRPPANPNPAVPGAGSDGQFYYYIALDPKQARYYLDWPSLRYSRILYPIAARALALGKRTAVPWTLLLINLLAVGGGTWALAVWLRRRGCSPWWALLYGLWPGMVVAVQRDLTEPLSYGLVVAALLLLDGRERWRLPLAGAVFGLAGLARQTTLVFPIVYAAWLAWGGTAGGLPSGPRAQRWRRALGLLVPSLIPYVAYSVFLVVWLGSAISGGDFSPIPFAGIFHPPFRISYQGIDMATVVLPATVALLALVPRRRPPHQSWLPWLLLLANMLAGFVFYGRFWGASYTTIGRVGIGVLLSAVMCVPYIAGLDRRRRLWLIGASTVAMAMLPVVAVYGFTNVSAGSWSSIR